MARLIGKIAIRELEEGKTFRFPYAGQEIEVTIESVEPFSIVSYTQGLPGEVSWEEANDAIEIWYDSAMQEAVEEYSENLAAKLGCKVETLREVTSRLAEENPEYLTNCQNAAESETWQRLGRPTDAEYEEFLALRYEAGY